MSAEIPIDDEEDAGCICDEENADLPALETTGEDDGPAPIHESSDSVPEGKRRLRIAVAGCVHGEVEKVYQTMKSLEDGGGGKFDLLLCCGDYQAARNYSDLLCMHVPEKYRSIENFWKYYGGTKVAPVLTIFIGGNHEASGYLSELPHGGWVAPNIYYMGFSGVVRFAGLRIGGLSGIFKASDYDKGHYERPPYNDHGSIISSYHVRSFDVFRCKQIASPMDIFMSHDWPNGIWEHGDVNTLLRIKPYFREDIEKGALGSPGARDILNRLRPRYWFSAHMHVKFPALVQHKMKDGETEQKLTRFLALDKPLPKRMFLQSLYMDVDADAPLHLEYDEEWLAILKSTDHLVHITPTKHFLPGPNNRGDRWNFAPTEEELAVVRGLGSLLIDPATFQRTAPPMKADDGNAKRCPPPAYYKNPQSTRFAQWLGIQDVNELLCALDPQSLGVPDYLRVDEELRGIHDQDPEEFGDQDFIIDNFAEDKEEDELGLGPEELGLGPEEEEGTGEEEVAHPELAEWAPPVFQNRKEGEEKRGADGEGDFVLKRRKVDDVQEED